MAKRTDPTSQVLKAAMALAAEKGWRATTLMDIAGRAGLPLAELYRFFPSKTHILTGIARQADAAVLAEGPADPEETPHDRVFDVLMRRFDALAPYKAGLTVVWAETRRHPLEGAMVAAGVRRSMQWMLEAAGVARPGIAGLLQAKGLAVVWIATLRTWFADDSEDLTKTMAALDANLRRAEEVWNSLPLSRRSAHEPKDASS